MGRNAKLFTNYLQQVLMSKNMGRNASPKLFLVSRKITQDETPLLAGQMPGWDVNLREG